MRKFYAVFAVLSALGFNANAQDNFTVHDFNDAALFIDFGGGYKETYGVAGVFNHVSSNGKYAVGCDDQGMTSEYGCAFLWRKDAPDQLESLSTKTLRVSALDVSNDGIVVGSYEVEAEGACYPAWRRVDNDEWFYLPVPENYSEYQAKEGYFADEARAITPDGKYIGGNIQYKVGTYEFQGTTFEKSIGIPIVWKQNDNGEYVIDSYNTELGKAGNHRLLEGGRFVSPDRDVSASYFFGRCITPDGKTYAGLNIAGSGGFNPAFVRDGILYQIYDCGEEEDEVKNFNGGCIYNSDAKGNLYGYYQQASGDITYFMISPSDRLSVLTDETLCADAAGNRYPISYQGMYPMCDCDDEGKVFVGAGTAIIRDMAYNYPICASENITDGIGKALNSNMGVSLDFDGNKASIHGAYLAVSLYDASGKYLKSAGQRQAIDLSAMPAGTYVLRVATAAGVKTFKVAK